MSELEAIAANLRGLTGDMTQWAGELESKASELRRLAAAASAAARDDPDARRSAAAFQAASRSCSQAAVSLVTARSASLRFADGLISDGARSLSAADAAAVEDLTGTGHQEVNSRLWGGTIADVESIAARATGFSHALEQFPSHEGTVFRGVPTNLSAQQLERYEPGETVTENGFGHTTTDPEREFGGNVLFVIDSKSGRNVSNRAAIPAEREVTFDYFTNFDVMSKDWVPDGSSPHGGRWIIFLVER